MSTPIQWQLRPQIHLARESLAKQHESRVRRGRDAMHEPTSTKLHDFKRKQSELASRDVGFAYPIHK